MSFTDFGFGPIAGQLWTILFLSARIGAALMAAPLFGGKTVPVPLRAMLSVVIGYFIASWMPLSVLPEPFSSAAIMALLQEIMIGLALGFVLQVAFIVPLIAGEQISGTMGLALATSIDPNSGTQSGAVGQYFSVLLTLIFLSIGAHLLWIELVVESYRLLPAGSAVFGAEQADNIVRFGGLAFATAAAIALPIVLVLLLVQLTTGVISRSAPSLNLFALGLPAGLLAGLAALIITLPILFEQFEDLSGLMVERASQLVAP
jgi:flagellar biosynthetic protein FliR